MARTRISRPASGLFAVFLVLVLAAAAVLASVACSALLDLSEPRYEDTDGAAEEPLGDATRPPPPPGDGGAGDSATPDPDFTDPARWSTYAGAVGGNYLPGAFDGRFVYFIRGREPDAPDAGEPNARVLRYDTTGDFASAASWTSFDPALYFATGPQLAATFDGRYLVIAGYGFGTFLRHDPRNASDQFTQPTGWESFDSRSFGATAALYSAATALDGRSYFAAINGARPLLRHGGGAAFDAGWQTFDPADAGGLSCTVGRIGATSGPYVYFGPTGVGATPSCIVRHDSRQPFGGPGWDAFDLSTLAADYRLDLLGLVGTPEHVFVTRYTTADAAAPFVILRKPAPTAIGEGWEAHPVAGDNPAATGYLGGAFDGTYVYFAPYPARSTTIVYLRYDTRRPYVDPAAWSAAAGAALRIAATSHQGALFDGTYVYYAGFLALGGTHEPLMVRYRAR